MKSAFISGASGQDAYFLTKLLIKKGYKVKLSTRTLTKKNKIFLENRFSKIFTKFDQLSFYELDLLCNSSVINFFKNNNFDEVYNLAGQSNVVNSFTSSTESESHPLVIYNNLIEGVMLTNKNTKVFQASSSEIFKDISTKKIDESTELDPKSPYATGKAKVHLEVSNTRKQNDIFVVSGIMFNHESELRKQNYLFGYIVKNLNLVLKNEIKTFPISNLNTVRDWGYAKEYVKAMWLMLNANKPSDYIISTGKSYSVQDIVNCAFSEVDLEFSRYTTLKHNPKRSYDIMKRYSNPKKINKHLLWKAELDGIDVIKLMVKKLIKNNRI